MGKERSPDVLEPTGYWKRAAGNLAIERHAFSYDWDLGRAQRNDMHACFIDIGTGRAQ